MPKVKAPPARTGQAEWPKPRDQIVDAVRRNFDDPRFDSLRPQIDELAEIAWKNYRDSRKAPRTRKAGNGFADPEYELSVEWLATRAAIRAAEVRHSAASAPRRVLLICASARNDKTCPGEMSKTFRLVTAAQEIFNAAKCEVDLLDLSELASDPRKMILPCKACVSTAMPLCHWPCSCYPNHSLGQVNDWMSELYPRWVAAHGVMIVTPVYWYQVPAGLKSMMDRLVCADGGNPDPSTTHGKNVAEAKQLELDGWDYPRHLADRAFGVVAHGDAEGADIVRRSLTDWLTDMRLVPAASQALLDRYIGYYEPYATSHDALDKDEAIFEETRNVARLLINKMRKLARGERDNVELEEPRPK